jgi:hypothetical protein
LPAVTGKLDRLIPWQHAARLVEETAGPVALLLAEDGNHGWGNVARPAVTKPPIR